MYTFEEYKQEALGNEELHREYEAIQPEYDIIKAMINTRTIQNLTQGIGMTLKIEFIPKSNE